VFSVLRGQDLDGNARDALSQFQQTATEGFDLPGTDRYLGMSQVGRYQRDAVSLAVPVAYRDQVCEHLTLTGHCPAAPGEALLSLRSAGQLGARIGDQLTVRPETARATVTLRVVGTYNLADPSGPYWANPLYASPDDSSTASARTDPVFVPLNTFAPGGFDGPQLVEDIVLPVDAFRQPGLGAAISHAEYLLPHNGMQVTVQAPEIIDRIAEDQQLINIGVLVGAGQLLALGWFSLYLAGRFTAQDRRRDVALLKLRGQP
jgi:putative ABC transport system permease protein